MLLTIRKGGGEGRGGTPRRAAPTFVQIWGRAYTSWVQMAGVWGEWGCAVGWGVVAVRKIAEFGHMRKVRGGHLIKHTR